MAYEDYSTEEIKQVCLDLLTECSDKLKEEEVTFIKYCYKCSLCVGIEHKDRDKLIGMYDRMIGDDT